MNVSLNRVIPVSTIDLVWISYIEKQNLFDYKISKVFAGIWKNIKIDCWMTSKTGFS